MPEKADFSVLFPTEAIDLVKEMLSPYNVRLEVKNLRSSLGRFQQGLNGNPHVIRMKHGMSKPLFLLVFLHELAHLYAFEQHGRGIKPHGREWKSIFRTMLQKMLPLKVFPDDVEQGLLRFMRNPKASMVNTGGFYNHFEEFSGFTDLKGMNPGDCFIINNRRFYQKLGSAKKYIRCRDLNNGKEILARASAHVKKIRVEELPQSIRKNLLAETQFNQKNQAF